MKRAAAIIGPTPPFIRWAIEVTCPFVRLAVTRATRNPAQTRWRQLRSLKEIARAKADGRVHAGYCFSSEATATNVLGIQIEEVTAPWGSATQIDESCLQCRGNPHPVREDWAPCTGILPLIIPQTTLTETHQAWLEHLNCLNQQIASNAAELSQPNLAQHELAQCSVNWHSTWQGPALESERLQLALQVLEVTADRFSHAPQDRKELQAALKHAAHHSMKVWIESVPIGWSDGQTWQLPPHCQACGAEWNGPGTGACPNCGSPGSFQAGRRLKVLGLRPFIQLSSVLGPGAAEHLFRDYQSTRAPNPSPNSHGT